MHKYIRHLVPFIFFFACFSSKAQNCSCSDNLKYVVERVKKNYVGYPDKISDSNRKRFELFTDSLVNKAQQAQTYQCLPIIREWLSFFKDKHLGITYDDSNYSREQIKNYYAKEETTEWTDNAFNAYLKEKSSTLDSLEGIWIDHSRAYQIGIVKDKKSKSDFIGFVIKADGARWTPQQVKLRITKKNGRYFLKYFRAVDHSLNRLSFQKETDTLILGDGIVTSRWYKNSVVVPKSTSQTPNNDGGPKFTILDDKTCMFSMPSYASLNYVNSIDSLIRKNSAEVAKRDHLIIDLRNNYGGSVLMYDKLMPFIYTYPILTEGASVLATEENIRDYYSHIPSNVPDSMKRIFESNLSKLKSHIGQLYPLYPVDTLRLSKVMNYPKSVSLLINRNTASAAELFILQARQSSKVKLYGSNSSGAIDYLEVVKTKLPCGFYSLGYPACKSLRLPAYPLDNIGIRPDVNIPAEVLDWINFVRTDQAKKRQ